MVPWLVSSVKSIQVLKLILRWKQFSVIQAFQSVNELCFSKLAVFCVHSLVTVKMSWVSLSPTWKFRLYFLSQSVLILRFVVKNCFLLLSWQNQRLLLHPGLPLRLLLCVGVSLKTVPQLVSPATSKQVYFESCVYPVGRVGCMSCSSILRVSWVSCILIVSRVSRAHVARTCGFNTARAWACDFHTAKAQGFAPQRQAIYQDSGGALPPPLSPHSFQIICFLVAVISCQLSHCAPSPLLMSVPSQASTCSSLT